MEDSAPIPLARIAYHHGHLRTALIEAGLDLTRTGGAAALVLREVTRRVGVSPNAAYRHFADRDELLAAVAERIQHEMAARMRELARALPAQPRELLRAVGLGYIEFALAEPGWFDVAFPAVAVEPGLRLVELAPDGAGAVPTPQTLDPAATAAPLALLVDALDALTAEGSLPLAGRSGAEWPCWSAVHGFAELALHGPLRHQSAEVVRSAAVRTVDAVITGLLADDATPPPDPLSGSGPTG